MFVRNHMTAAPVTIAPETPIFDALNIMKRNKIRQLPVVLPDGTLVGLVTERDLLMVSPSPATTLSIYEVNYLLSKMTVREAMIKSPAMIKPEATLEEAAVIMREHKFGSLLVIDEGKMVGIITESDLFDAFIKVFGFRRPGTRLVVVADNRMGVLADLLAIIRDHKMNVIGLAALDMPDQRAQIMVRLAATQLGSLLEELPKKGFEVQAVN
ncbi:MAG: CBS and ACT domain-containing protein [Coprothermobacterota bacterium]|nr:CBS and ACT domain-containing protein [Coprothermobacterota bacterium]